MDHKIDLLDEEGPLPEEPNDLYESPVSSEHLPALRGDEVEAVVPQENELLYRYFAEISRHPLLSREEEERLTREYYETRDPKVASQIVLANLRLVVKIALDFQRFWTRNFLDLVQEGNIGLMQAVRKFDPYRGVKFSYYASFWIRAYILKFIMDNWRLVKIGTTQAQRKLFYNLQKEKNRLLALGYEPVPKLISERMNVSEKDVIDMESRLGSHEFSLDSPISSEGEDTHLDFLPSANEDVETQVIDRQLHDRLSSELDAFAMGLTGKEKVVFERRLLTEEPATLQELGKEFGLSRERVRQIEAKLKSRLIEFLRQKMPDLASHMEGSGKEV
ncbi:MAG: RNA polymerase factor sigma-32 [Deltaproteobacteria bacterium]